MNHSTSDILLTTPAGEIKVWRRIGGTNPGYGLDIDGRTVAFQGNKVADLKKRATEEAASRGLTIAKPAVERVAIAGTPNKPAENVEADRMFGRFLAGEVGEGWGENMYPQGE